MKILIIQQKMIGDVLTSSILFEVIKYNYPNSELHYLINTHTYPVVENNPYIDRFHFFTATHEEQKIKLWEFAKQLKQERFDYVIDVYSKLSSNIISYLSKANVSITKHKWYSSFLYTHSFKYHEKPKTKAGLAIENRLQLLEPLNVTIPKIAKPKIYLTDNEKLKAKQFLKSNGIDFNASLFMISVLGSGYNKTYPANYMAKVIDTIVEQHPKCQILFNYIPKQEADAKKILEACKNNTQKQIKFNIFGKSLREFLGVLSHCDAIIGNEGGAINMAKALEIKTFAIYSPWIDKASWNSFKNSDNIGVHLKDYQPKLYTKAEKKYKKEALNLYQKFVPELFLNDLKRFLKF